MDGMSRLPERFLSVPRKPDVYDQGNWWRLRSAWPQKVVEEPRLYPPPHPIQPPFQMSYPNELGPDSSGTCSPVKKLRSLTLNPITNEACGLTALPRFNNLNLPFEIKKKQSKVGNIKPLDADEIRTGRTGIARAGLNRIMWEQGQDLIKQCQTPQPDNE
ncbi:hypothetical protein Clacol_009776 [Clathrus columnatus]|uniref:Uncharacterized protein n=1 Tax=Clathrus columnatus TaxID=1419009 RepID=A0AAV5APR3_9AGAM|nr:hypothetical protein Clacol_009776 [Clathrus columnatus]